MERLDEKYSSNNINWKLREVHRQGTGSCAVYSVHCQCPVRFNDLIFT
jgi:hypothetical protein